MADIYVAIHNQAGAGMSSILGELIIVLVASDRGFQAEQPVNFRIATAVFQNLPQGTYSIIARHPALTPTEARYNVTLDEKSLLGIRFTYNEPERRLFSIETELTYLP